MTRAESLDLLRACKVTLASVTADHLEHPEVRVATMLGCVATTLLVIAHTLIEKGGEVTSWKRWGM